MNLGDSRAVLFVADDASFLINAIREGFEKANIPCLVADLDVNLLGNLPVLPKKILLHVDATVAEDQEGLIYIRDLCVGDGRILYLFGYEDETKEVTNMMPDNIIGDIFLRPINAKEIVDRMADSGAEEDDESRKKHILVVDDSGPMLHTIKGWLEPDYKVSMVNSATNALSFLATNVPDLILLDYEMPICSGPQMMKMIQAEGRSAEIPIMFLTSKAEKECVETALSLKPKKYLLKTMSSTRIHEIIDEFFREEERKAKRIKA